MTWIHIFKKILLFSLIMRIMFFFHVWCNGKERLKMKSQISFSNISLLFWFLEISASDDQHRKTLFKHCWVISDWRWLWSCISWSGSTQTTCTTTSTGPGSSPLASSPSPTWPTWTWGSTAGSSSFPKLWRQLCYFLSGGDKTITPRWGPDQPLQRRREILPQSSLS